jgi:hypothetical protein
MKRRQSSGEKAPRTGFGICAGRNAGPAFEWENKAYDERDGQDITLLK